LDTSLTLHHLENISTFIRKLKRNTMVIRGKKYKYILSRETMIGFLIGYDHSSVMFVFLCWSLVIERRRKIRYVKNEWWTWDYMFAFSLRRLTVGAFACPKERIIFDNVKCLAMYKSETDTLAEYLLITW